MMIVILSAHGLELNFRVNLIVIATAYKCDSFMGKENNRKIQE